MGLTGKSNLVLQKLLKFYSNPLYLSIIMEIPHDGNYVSLRLLDYFATNYTCNNQVWINGVDIHDDYKKMLYGYNKELFDPFCRKERVLITTTEMKEVTDSNGKKVLQQMSLIKDRDELLKRKSIKLQYAPCPKHLWKKKSATLSKPGGCIDGIVTTVAQLHFFSWCIERNIIMYALKNSKKIQGSMASVGGKKSKSTVYKKVMNFRIAFN